MYISKDVSARWDNEENFNGLYDLSNNMDNFAITVSSRMHMIYMKIRTASLASSNSVAVAPIVIWIVRNEWLDEIKPVASAINGNSTIKWKWNPYHVQLILLQFKLIMWRDWQLRNCHMIGDLNCFKLCTVKRANRWWNFILKLPENFTQDANSSSATEPPLKISNGLPKLV